MLRFVLRETFILALMLWLTPGLHAAPPVPEWICVDNKFDSKPVYFRRTFEVAGAIHSALLVTSCEANCAVQLNGKVVLNACCWRGLRLGQGPRPTPHA